jgi:hypothetical protein
MSYLARRLRTTHRQRLEQLRGALVRALATPDNDNLREVSAVLSIVASIDDLDANDITAAIEMHCDGLARLLTRQLGDSAPDWLRRFTCVRCGLRGVSDGPKANRLVYEYRICGAEIESEIGSRVRCVSGHAPAVLAVRAPRLSR